MRKKIHMCEQKDNSESGFTHLLFIVLFLIIVTVIALCLARVKSHSATTYPSIDTETFVSTARQTMSKELGVDESTKKLTTKNQFAETSHVLEGPSWKSDDFYVATWEGSDLFYQYYAELHLTKDSSKNDENYHDRDKLNTLFKKQLQQAGFRQVSSDHSFSNKGVSADSYENDLAYCSINMLSGSYGEGEYPSVGVTCIDKASFKKEVSQVKPFADLYYAAVSSERGSDEFDELAIHSSKTAGYTLASIAVHSSKPHTTEDGELTPDFTANFYQKNGQDWQYAPITDEDGNIGCSLVAKSNTDIQQAFGRTPCN